MRVKVSEDFALNFPLPELSSAEFLQFCLDNEAYRIERNAEGRIEIERNAGWRTSNRNACLTAQLGIWAEQDGRGTVFGSGALFELPSTAMRAASCCWIVRERLQRLQPEDPEGILPIRPDFVVELVSKIDRLRKLQAKMCEWMEGGCELGWLIAPESKTVYVYRGSDVQTLVEPSFIEGSWPVAGFKLDLRSIWATGW